MTLSGLRSRCSTPRECASSIALQTASTTSMCQPSGSARCSASMWAGSRIAPRQLCPSMRFITTAGAPSCTARVCTGTMFGCAR